MPVNQMAFVLLAEWKDSVSCLIPLHCLLPLEGASKSRYMSQLWKKKSNSKPARQWLWKNWWGPSPKRRTCLRKYQATLTCHSMVRGWILEPRLGAMRYQTSICWSTMGIPRYADLKELWAAWGRRTGTYEIRMMSEASIFTLSQSWVYGIWWYSDVRLSREAFVHINSDIW